jgi:hypothetical protein
MNEYPKSHGDKLIALLGNPKLPNTDKPRIDEAVKRYNKWLADMAAIKGTKANILNNYVALFNSYKKYVDLDVIFDSPSDFLYRQKGQLKLDNSVIEEFLPILVGRYFENEVNKHNLQLGPTTCVSGIRFDSSLAGMLCGGGIELRQKDQDFAISRRIYIRASHQKDLSDGITKESNIAFVACECKTNLDKTMFQEAAATALDVKTAVPCARYFLLCEWLDMTPIATSTTAIDEIILLRKAKRLGSDTRKEFNDFNARKRMRNFFVSHLDAHPFVSETFKRFLDHIEMMLTDDEESKVLEKGYF